MISFGNEASSHSGLIPLKTAYEKRGELLWAIASKNNFYFTYLILLTIPKKAPVLPQQNSSLKGNVVTFVYMLLYFAGLNSLER